MKFRLAGHPQSRQASGHLVGNSPQGPSNTSTVVEYSQGHLACTEILIG
jgi:hypothetical protein